VAVYSAGALRGASLRCAALDPVAVSRWDRGGGIGKGKVFPYSLPSVVPGADPGVQAVSPQVT